MARTCDICGGKIGLKGFHCQDGTICKNCYKVVSNNFSQFITTRTLRELRRIYERNGSPIDLGEGGFMKTKKIGTFLLIDENNKKFCLPGNPAISGKYSKPQVYTYDKLAGFKIATTPDYSPEELAGFVEDKKNSHVVKNLKVRVKIKDEGIHDVPIIPTPVRSSTFAYRKGYEYAMQMIRELNAIFEESNK